MDGILPQSRPVCKPKAANSCNGSRRADRRRTTPPRRRAAPAGGRGLPLALPTALSPAVRPPRCL